MRLYNQCLKGHGTVPIGNFTRVLVVVSLFIVKRGQGGVSTGCVTRELEGVSISSVTRGQEGINLVVLQGNRETSLEAVSHGKRKASL
jgi:hypothetical protein